MKYCIYILLEVVTLILFRLTSAHYLPTLRKAQIETDFFFVFFFQKGLCYVFKIDTVTSSVTTDCAALAFVTGKSSVQTSAW
jgi:hypothetical protein